MDFALLITLYLQPFQTYSCNTSFKIFSVTVVHEYAAVYLVCNNGVKVCSHYENNVHWK